MKYIVNSAYYGAYNCTPVDVTQQLKDLFELHQNDEFFSVLINFETFNIPDPAEGTVKSLVVEYICTDSGVTIIKSGVDEQTLIFSADGNGITIYSATYSSVNTCMDLRLSMQSYVSQANGATHFDVGSPFFLDCFCGGQIFDAGFVKTLKVTYTVNGAPQKILIASDGQHVDFLS